MTSTSYNTLTLGEVEPRKSRSKAVYVVVGLAVVAFAGAAAFLVQSSGHVNSATDAVYQAIQGDEVICQKDAAGFLESLPKYDASYGGTSEEFYNACYYSFRCCTTTGNSASCYVSEAFGEKCRECIKQNGPRMTRKICSDYANQKLANGRDWSNSISFAEQSAPPYSVGDMKNDINFPDPITADLKLPFAIVANNAEESNTVPTCWPQAGSSDRRMREYSDKCFEVLSWCNLLCPRDAANSIEHKMCKHCTLLGFQDANPSIVARKEGEAAEIARRAAIKAAEAQAQREAWLSKWTI